MEEKKIAEQADETSAFEMRERNTTYVIGIHFSEKSKDTMDKKIKRLIRDEVKKEAFS